jgi:hypothetical protein
MSWPAEPIGLLAGPRGRRLCFELVSPYRDDPGAEAYPGLRGLRFGPGGADPPQLAAELSDLVARTDLAELAATASEAALLEPAAEAVTAAMYWQPPDDIDQVLADPLLAGVLAPVAQAVAAAPAARWWSSPADEGHQRYVQFLSRSPEQSQQPPELNGAAAMLADWRASTIEQERDAASRPPDPAAPYSGFWWSTPTLALLVSTTRPVPGLPAVGLALVEDPMDWTEARTWPLRPRPDARLYEIRGPEDWIELVARHPLDVTRSRWHDWWKVTGRAGTWLIPDFAAVAEDYDGVHLTVGGYLSTAGRALPADAADGDPEGAAARDPGAAATMLAGWNPDQTFWLADVLAPAGPAARFENPGREVLGWEPADDPAPGG